MAARPLVTVYNGTTGAAGEQVPLPSVFTAPIRRDVVHIVHKNMSKNSRQAYAVNKDAGMQHSAESWGTGRAVSRIPRISGSGTHRASQGAFGNMCRQGRMFAPTKTWRRWHRKIAVNQRRYATVSALAATAVPALVMARGHKVSAVNEIPLVISEMEGVSKTKDALAMLARFGADEDVTAAIDSKKIRPGKGKARDRRYVMRKGPLVIHSGSVGVERAFRNLPGVDIAHVDRLNLLQLAPGGHLGRFCVWSDAAFAKLEGLYGSATTESTEKSGYKLPSAMMTNADLARVINSTEVQSKLRAAIKPTKYVVHKKNPLKNLGAMIKLNPYILYHKRSETLAAEKAGERRDKRRSTRTDKALRAASKSFYKGLTSDDWTS